MVDNVRYWLKGGIFKMGDEKFYLTALGAYELAHGLERVEWAVAASDDPAYLAPFLERLRFYEEVHCFEDIGREARLWHDALSRYTQQKVAADAKDGLRSSITRWQTLARERLQDFYLVLPNTKLEPKHLMKGAQGFLTEGHFALLGSIEVSDLNEACGCLVVGSATAAEHIALRAAESLLRRWYERKTGIVLRYRTWGAVLKKLAAEYPEKGRPKEITLLGYLKLRRDEVAHPERLSSLTEAETTLMNVCSLIQGIAPVLAAAVQGNDSTQQHGHIA